MLGDDGETLRQSTSQAMMVKTKLTSFSARVLSLFQVSVCYVP